MVITAINSFDAKAHVKTRFYWLCMELPEDSQHIGNFFSPS